MNSRWIPLLLWTLTLGVTLAPARVRAADFPATPVAGLRRLDTDAPSSSAAAATATDDDPDDTAAVSAPKPRRHRADGNDDVNVMSSTHVEAGKTVEGDAVAVMGSVTVDGHVTGDAVAVMGNNTINGPVDGDVVCVMGNLTLGPKAHVGHDVTCVMGKLTRDPAAVIDGGVHIVGLGVNAPFSSPGARNWWDHGLSHGSMLAFGPGLIWLWFLNLVVFGLYIVMALIAPEQTRRTGDLLRLRPGLVIVSALLGGIAFPLVFFLLLFTLIGIPVALMLLPAAGLLTLFGKGSIYALIGRALTKDRMHPAGCILLGGLLCLVALMLPLFGLAFYCLLTFLGWGCGVAALLTAKDGPKGSIGASPTPTPPPAVPAAPAPVAPPASAAYYGAGLASAASAAPVPPPSAEIPPEPAAALPPPPAPVPPAAPDADALTGPRAGFWIRTAGLAIDAILVGFLTSACGSVLRAVSFGRGSHDCGFGAFLLILAIYGAVMWKIKEATIGGLICNLRVVRLDGRPLDWPTAVVRALGCFISLFAAGLGFIWVAFDAQRQSWHDKIAGTTVVQPLKRRSLV